ncbi:hypothetical protein CEUSTIGMA_g3539.t1 [Chlamydomonas eustigma]|uniref:Enhancer of mRNA-decapping protein 4 C-terminal domain-containing protein n=1 Tax=Chlamydomonas eustigma TaxID=1157962 RepID=A0A250WZ84_9CHLO|nr:hypothetical protein CEUSTIGMA_g3539.t1 [Chlamydomonas eustigma]|eukprot:GAX76096.1 hypothetical protein CEUSTIGMA_g3539.t1 [Chlamydomonas eustigma]
MPTHFSNKPSMETGSIHIYFHHDMTELIDIGSWLAGMNSSAPQQESHDNMKVYSSHAVASTPLPRSLASDALASAISTGMEGTKFMKRESHGISLNAAVNAVQFDIDAHRSVGDQQPQLQVTPITQIKNEFRLQVLHQIAINSSFICYGLKAGHIRALHKISAARTLFKEHRAPVSDMRFFSGVSNLLASIDLGGLLVIRKLCEVASDSSASCDIGQELLITHSFYSAAATCTRRLAWYPQLDSVLAVSNRDIITLVNVPPTQGVASSPEFANPSSPSCPMVESGALVTSLAFSSYGDLLAVSDDRGFVYLWSVGQDLVQTWMSSAALEPLSGEADVKFRAGFEGSAYASALDFLPNQKEGKGILIIGDVVCRMIKVWSVAIEGIPQCCHTLELTSSIGGPESFFNHFILQPRFNAVILANTKGKQVFVVHVGIGEDGTDAHFDHIAAFSVTQPILSLTTTEEARNEDGCEVFHLFTIQTEGVQQYTLYPEMCLPAVASTDLTSAPKGQHPAAVTTMTADAAMPAATEPSTGVMSTEFHVTDASIQPLSPPLLSPSGLIQQPATAGNNIPTTSSEQADLFHYPGLTAAAAAAAAAAVSPENPVDHMPPLTDSYLHSPPLPPPPSFLVSKLSAAGSSKAADAGMEASINEVLTSASLATQVGGSIGSITESTQPDVTSELVHQPLLKTADELTAQMSARLREKSKKAGTSEVEYRAENEKTAASLASSLELGQVLSLQHQLMGQLAANQQDTMKQIRAEIAKATMATEATMKAYLKRADQERAKEAKKEREDLEKQLQLLVNTVIKDLSMKIMDTSRATTVAVTKAVTTAVAEALPLALSSGATQLALEHALSRQLQDALPRAVAESFSATIIPSFERASQAMFGQMDSALSSGLRTHLESSRSASEEVGAAVREAVREAVTQMQGTTRQMSAAAASLAAVAATVGTAGIPACAEGGKPPARGAISLAELEARKDPKVIISGHLSSGSYEAAFMEALNTADPEITLWLCKQIQADTVFDVEPCPLSQEVLLSLVTHLAHQLPTADTEVKLSWLLQTAPALDPKHPGVAGHCRQVLEPVKAQLTNMARTLSGDTGKQVKTAVHLVNSLLHQ